MMAVKRDYRRDNEISKHYIFAGTMQNGGKNNIPVAFYDPNLPVSQNRWVRYGYTGVASAYIQKGDNIRIHTLSLGYDINTKKVPPTDQGLTAYAQNLLRLVRL